jgi:hypothetical protein
MKNDGRSSLYLPDEMSEHIASCYLSITNMLWKQVAIRIHHGLPSSYSASSGTLFALPSSDTITERQDLSLDAILNPGIAPRPLHGARLNGASFATASLQSWGSYSHGYHEHLVRTMSPGTPQKFMLRCTSTREGTVILCQDLLYMHRGKLAPLSFLAYRGRCRRDSSIGC